MYESQLSHDPVIDYADWALRTFGLQRAWDYVCMWHTENLGYHNLDHLLIVVGAAAQISVRQNLDPRPAVIAAMFHDMGHSGGARSDHVNISVALQHVNNAANWGLLPFAAAVDDSSNSDQLLTIKQAIASTKFIEGVWPNDPVNHVACIVRDADLWNPHLTMVNAVRMISGLGDELGIGQTTSVPDQIAKTKQFFDQVVWHTEYAQSIANQVQPRLTAAYKQYGGM